MTGRPRTSGGGQGNNTPPSRSGRRPQEPQSVVEGQSFAGDRAQAGRLGNARQTGNSAGPASPATPASPDEVKLAQIITRHAQLGDEPPEFNIARNDSAYEDKGAHTDAKHGPGIPLRRSPGIKTIEGRIYGDPEWKKAANASHQWTDHTTMNREINDYVRRNWTKIRDDLAFDETHEATFDAGHRVGQGFHNKGMFGAGPRQAEYGETSLVRIVIKVVPGSDPAEPFILTAYPAALG